MTFEFEDHQLRLKERFTREARDRDDLHHEIAGRDVGRIRRFLPDGVQNAEVAEKRRAERVRTISHLQALLQSDPAYAALYRETEDFLASAERASETALEKTEQRLTGANEALADLMGRTPALGDGRKVFQDAAGRAWTEDGELLSPEDAAAIDWPAHAPGYDDFRARKDAVLQARAEMDAILRYQVDVLGLARDRMSEPDNPPDQDALIQIKRDIDSAMPVAVRQELPTEPQEVPASKPDMAAAKPSL